jgi:hypothetical protein
MTLVSSGTIRMSDINTELGRSSTATISLDSAENGSYATINTNSTSRPSSTNPASMSEWYGYNHNAAAPVTCTNTSFGFNRTNQNTACSNYNFGTFTGVGMVGSTLADATSLKRADCSNTILASVGFYSNGVIVRYWTGTAFTTQFDCTV